MKSKFEKDHLKHLHESLIWLKKTLKQELQRKTKRTKRRQLRTWQLRNKIERTKRDIREWKKYLSKR